MTYPLILHFSSLMPGNGGDQYLMTWFFWEFYHYVFVLHKFPYFTHLVYYPFGVPLFVTTDMPVNSFIASIIYYFSHNLLLAFNIIFLLSSFLNGYFAYLLANDVLKNRTASFFAGLIFAFSPVLIEQARWGDINIWSCYGIPLYILFFNRLYKEPTVKNAVGAAAGLFLAAYAGFYEFTAMLLVYSLFFIVYKFIEEDYQIRRISNTSGQIKIKKHFFYGFDLKTIRLRIKNNIYNNNVFSRKYVKSLLLMTGLFVFVSSPLLLPAIYYVYLKPGILELNPTLFWTKAYSSTFINLFIPPFFNHWLLPLTKAIYFNKFYPVIDRGMNSNNFLGYIPILFFTAGIYYYFKLKKDSINNINKSIKLLNGSGIKNINKDELNNFKFYLVAFIFFLLMALSPLIHIVNNIRVFDPFVYILDILPVIKDVQESGRYMIIGMLFFGICAGFGIKYFLENMSVPLSFLTVTAIFVFTVLGYSSFGFEMNNFKITKGIYKLKEAPDGPVLVIPFVQGGFKMYQQTIYQKPMYAGYVIRYGFHNLYKKYLPYRFYDNYGMNQKTNFNQVEIYRLGVPKDLIRNFKYLKILKVKYLLILKNRLDEYAWVYGNKKSKQESLYYINKFVKTERGKVNVLYNGKNIMILKLNC